MNKENASKLWKIIQEAGDYLLGQSDNLSNTIQFVATNAPFHGIKYLKKTLFYFLIKNSIIIIL